MEFLIKLSPSQLPRIGICYSSEYLALKAYEDLLKKFYGERYKAELEVLRGSMQLSLVPANGGPRIYYKSLDFKIEQIKKLNQLVSPDQEIEFVHVYKKSSQCFIAKAKYKKAVFLKLSGYQLVMPSNFQ